jgi:hypothetical protein
MQSKLASSRRFIGPTFGGSRANILDAHGTCAIQHTSILGGAHIVAKTKKKKPSRKQYTAADIKLLRQHSNARTPVSKIAKLMKRSEASLRQKALKLGIGLGHQR